MRVPTSPGKSGTTRNETESEIFDRVKSRFEAKGHKILGYIPNPSDKGIVIQVKSLKGELLYCTEYPQDVPYEKGKKK